ncbi:MAG: cyclic pyranopterin monophosphate synthase MoaC [Deltaproteobacteria bacterium]|nr:cyclic pyranopterin monophosphate synthase MoaC [Deltaproteobacteria bacterium]
MGEFTHIDKNGSVRMVDVTEKGITERVAVAKGYISMNRDTFDKIYNNQVKKGNVLETARIAGIMAAKKTHELIPMCHPLNITYAGVDFIPVDSESRINIRSEVRVTGQTGVEMEALTAVSISALTIYDMCKSYDKEMVISEILLSEKKGGKSGHFVRS